MFAWTGTATGAGRLLSFLMMVAMATLMPSSSPKLPTASLFFLAKLMIALIIESIKNLSLMSSHNLSVVIFQLRICHILLTTLKMRVAELLVFVLMLAVWIPVMLVDRVSISLMLLIVVVVVHVAVVLVLVIKMGVVLLVPIITTIIVIAVAMKIPPVLLLLLLVVLCMHLIDIIIQLIITLLLLLVMLFVHATATSSLQLLIIELGSLLTIGAWLDGLNCRRLAFHCIDLHTGDSRLAMDGVGDVHAVYVYIIIVLICVCVCICMYLLCYTVAIPEL